MTFDEAFEKLIGHEGGYVNNPADPGGETKYGISKRSYPNVDIAALTLDEAKAIYKRDFWLDALPGAVAFQVFDASVNSGRRQAIKWLQRAVGAVDDGVLGTETLLKLSTASFGTVVARFNAERLEFMTNLPTWQQFGKGWARRIAANLKV